MRCLIVTDSPLIPTGMGRVGREIALGLYKKGYDISYLAWFSSPHVEGNMPFKIHKTNNNYYGQDVFDSVIYEERPDVVITIGDIWMVSHIANTRSRGLFTWVMYSPIDGASYHGGVPNSWVDTFKNADVVVAYTEYGKKTILKSLPELENDIKVIPHGVDTNIYKPLPTEEVLKARLIAGVMNKVVFLMVARNQFRKNVPEFCKAWKMFKAGGRHEKAVFMPHMCFYDPMGWNLFEIFDIYDMKKSLVYFLAVANAESNIDLMPEKDLVSVYNICDVFVLISGEGFGLPTLEAMACGKPCIVLDHSANTELVQGRGELVKVGNYMTGKYSTERPYPDLVDLSNKMDILYRDDNLRKEYGQKALEFAKTLTWENAVNMWDDLLQDINNPLRKPITMTELVCK